MPLDYIDKLDSHSTVGEGLNTLHVDTVISTIICCAIILYSLRVILRKTKSARNFKGLAILTIISNYINSKIAGIKNPKSKSLIYALILFIIGFISVGNLTSCVPISTGLMIQNLFTGSLRHNNQNIIPTENFNTTLALAIISNIVIWRIIYLEKNGLKGVIHTIFLHPVNKKAYIPINFFLFVLELFSSVISLAVRLYVNVFCGSLMTACICRFTLPAAAISYALWTLFHIPILIIQAIIFCEIIVNTLKLHLN